LDRLFTPRIQIELTLQPNSSGTRLTVSGLFARDMAEDPSSDPEVSRHLANECVRSLIEKVAEEIEKRKVIGVNQAPKDRHSAQIALSKRERCARLLSGS